MSLDLNNGLVFEQLFHGQFEDFSGNNIDGTLTGTATDVVDELNRLNSAKQFASGSSYLSLGDPAGGELDFGTGDFSFHFRLKASTISSNIPVYGGRPIGSGGAVSGFVVYLLSAGSGTPYFQLEDSSSIVTDSHSTGIVDGEFHDVIFTFDRDGNATIYVDCVGESVSIASVSGSVSNSSNKEIHRANGTATPVTGQALTYSIVRAWNRLLNQEEVNFICRDIKNKYVGLFNGLVFGSDFKKDAKDFNSSFDGTVTGADPVSDEFGLPNSAYDFISTNSDRISYGNVGNIKTVVMRINLDSTTENIFEESSGNGVSASAGTLSYTNWDNAFVNGVDTDTVGTGWTTIVITSSTNIAASAFVLGRISTTYGNFACSHLMTFSEEFDVTKAKQFHDLLSSGYIYPYPQNRENGVTS